MKYLIYALIDPTSYEIRYVGRSSSGLARPKEHFKPFELGKRNYKANWIRGLVSEGLVPEIFVLQVVDCADDLNPLEMLWISRCKSEGHHLTNLTEGGEGTIGYKHRVETKKKLSFLKQGKAGTKGIPSPYKGKRRGTPSETHRANMSAAQRRIAKNEEVVQRRLKVLAEARSKAATRIKCSNGNEYASIASAARELSLHKPNIIAVLKGRYKTTGGYSFSYIGVANV
jgi:group I intron endonuclease